MKSKRKMSTVSTLAFNHQFFLQRERETLCLLFYLVASSFFPQLWAILPLLTKTLKFIWFIGLLGEAPRTHKVLCSWIENDGIAFCLSISIADF